MIGTEGTMTREMNLWGFGPKIVKVPIGFEGAGNGENN